ncbi:MAG: lytic transglycosylase domain-containing protein [Candidatus Hydrogenedentes bacterium]|nr:lytic transglycosylase domain-containing protein [Candidatus Hydrogenedentota bacterium]
MGAFQPKDGGVPMLTNRTYKYRKLNGYQEIKIDFDPIVVPNRYRIPPAIYSDSQINELVTMYSKQYGLDENLVHAMINVESGGNAKAVSNKGASGLMQLMPGTAADMGVENIFDPAQNIAGGTQYMSKLMGIFGGNVAFALAGYNAGPENVKQYGGIPPFTETQNYVRLVLDRWRAYNGGGSYAYATVGGTPPVIPTLPKKVAKNSSKPAPKAPVPDAKQNVTFKSGHVQIADRVVQEGDFYYIEVNGVNRRIHKNQVESVQPGEAKLAAKM